jgi:hypothetical protein
MGNKIDTVKNLFLGLTFCIRETLNDPPPPPPQCIIFEKKLFSSKLQYKYYSLHVFLFISVFWTIYELWNAIQY